jgi:hypothetical protein
MPDKTERVEALDINQDMRKHVENITNNPNAPARADKTLQLRP